MADMDPPNPTSHIFVSQRLRLHYLDWGNEAAPPLLLIHGGRDHARSWDWAARRLRQKWHVIAPDLRGHGDSAWSPDGSYWDAAFTYDLAQLIHQQGFETVTIVGHSLGGNIALRYTGLYPEKVRRLVAIEGLGLSPTARAERAAKPVEARLAGWIEERRQLGTRQPRRYSSLDEALARMRAENTHLTEEQVRHLTIHGISRNEDGSYSWKFDNYLRSFPPNDLTHEEIERLWGRIACPTLLVYGDKSWASNPEKDGRASAFKNARVVSFADAGHWVHHDRFEAFMAELDGFL